MASLYAQSSSVVPASTVALLLLMSLPVKILAQDALISPNATLADCSTRLLLLTPCAPFVQGMAQSPPPTCCNNLKQLSRLQPACICLLLNDTGFASFPINSTLAQQLPAFCSLQLNCSSCSGARTNSSSGIHGDSSTTNSSVAASPTIQVAPRPVIPLGFGRSIGIKLKEKGLVVLLVTLPAVLLT